jgi:hypothetical protein
MSGGWSGFGASAAARPKKTAAEAEDDKFASWAQSNVNTFLKAEQGEIVLFACFLALSLLLSSAAPGSFTL